MSGDRFDRERALFEEVIALPPADRAARLRESCADDEDLRSRVDRLVRQADRSAPTPVIGVVGPTSGTAEGPRDAIGPYRLVELLGEGGFGSVYLAEQQEPVRRTVALKVIKLGMDTAQVIARFEVERQALAMMDHPGIARVLDAGATASGRPYFVMDLVRGVPITEYCEAERLSTNERLLLFARVCAAVQHAHQKGVIHRDLKPSNVLVARGDDGPAPKVIDFGIAKATGPPLTESSLHTRAQDMVGTPEYMSPEQAAMGAVDIDTRSDIYALGILLYELLTGHAPFDRDVLRTATLADLQRIILEETPPRPSTRAKHLRGDLDRIVMKAVEKAPARRYSTAEALADDIRRYLANEPVLASPTGSWYRARMFARRNRTAVCAAALVLLALVTGATLATAGLVHARRERDIATERLRGSYIDQARAARSSARIGRRVHALDVLARAAAIRPSRELRNEVIACLTMDDLVAGASVDVEPGAIVSARGLRSIDRIAIASTEGAGVRVIGLPDGRALLETGPTPPYPRVLEFSAGGRFLAIKYHDGDDVRLHVWDVDRRARVLALDGSVFRHNGIAFAPDGAWVALTLANGVHVFGLPEGTPDRTFPIDGDPWFLAAHPDSARLAVARLEVDEPLHVIDVRTGAELARMGADGVLRGLAWSPDGRLLAGACSDHHVYLWDGATGERRALLGGHQGDAVTVAFDASGTRLASSGWDQTVRLWDVATGAPLIEALRQSRMVGLGADLATTGWAGGPVTMWRFEPSRALRRIHATPPFGDVCQMDTAGAARWLVTAARNGVRVWDLVGDAEPIVLTDQPARSALFEPGPSAAVAIVAIVADLGLMRWPLHATGAGLDAGAPEMLWPDRGLGRACLSADGGSVIVQRPPEIVLFDLARREPTQILDADVHLGEAPSVTPDGRWMATGTWRGRAGRVWDLETGTTVRTFEGRHVRCAFATGAPLLAVCRPDTYRFHEVGTWALRFEVRRSAQTNPGRIAFSPDGRTAAIMNSLDEIALVDCASGETLAEFSNPDGKRVTELRLVSSPERLLASTPDGEIHVWELGLIRDQLRTLDLDWELPDQRALER